MPQQSEYFSQSFHLPRPSTPLIGRTAEIAEITDLLADPACRLITLIGPGGMGKTRLVLQTAQEVIANFAQGVFFIPLQAVESSDFLVSAITDAINFSLYGSEDPQQQLLTYLSDKEILLVLDNFEQLLAADGASLLSDILAIAPAVKLLVTSREVLNLQEEWLYPVGGMSFPNSDQPGEVETYSAVQLFVERARRMRRDFVLADEQADVIRICQLVEGSPLAIELAASWTKTMRCSVIAAELQRNLDFLATNLRNVPERQRSMRAVFNHSWELLTDIERSVFMRLSVFRGSFRRTAAERIAGASLATLSALVDKSLLQSDGEGRYQIHELLHQYAAEQLVQSPDDVGRVYDLHCTYYADFLYERLDNMLGGRQREATAEIKAELENIRAAWQWAIELRKVEEIKKSAGSLDAFYQYQSRYVEGAKAFEKAILYLKNQEATQQHQLILAEVLVYLAWYQIRLGQFEKAGEVLEESRTISERYQADPPAGLGTDPLTALAILAIIRGDYATATALGEQSRQASEARADQQNLSFAYYVLTSALAAQGQFETARQYAQRAYELTKASQARWFMAYCLNEWGNVARAMGDYAEARQHYQASYTIRQEFDDPEGMAVALNHLGKVAVLQEDYAEAERLYQEGLSIYREINDRGGLATSLTGLGTTAWARGEYDLARRHLEEALQIAAEIRFVPLLLSILLSVGELLVKTGRPEQGLELLVLVRQHPASERATKNQAQRCLDLYQAKFPSHSFADVIQREQTADLSVILPSVQAELAGPIEVEALTVAGQQVASTSPLHPSASALIEPLTPRELEVLQLIANGLTNQQIADELVISAGTVKFYTSQIYGKLEVNSRTQAVARAREVELLP